MFEREKYVSNHVSDLLFTTSLIVAFVGTICVWASALTLGCVVLIVAIVLFGASLFRK